MLLCVLWGTGGWGLGLWWAAAGGTRAARRPFLRPCKRPVRGAVGGLRGGHAGLAGSRGVADPRQGARNEADSASPDPSESAEFEPARNPAAASPEVATPGDPGLLARPGHTRSGPDIPGPIGGAGVEGGSVFGTVRSSTRTCRRRRWRRSRTPSPDLDFESQPRSAARGATGPSHPASPSVPSAPAGPPSASAERPPRVPHLVLRHPGGAARRPPMHSGGCHQVRPGVIRARRVGSYRAFMGPRAPMGHVRFIIRRQRATSLWKVGREACEKMLRWAARAELSRVPYAPAGPPSASAARPPPPLSRSSAPHLFLRPPPGGAARRRLMHSG